MEQHEGGDSQPRVYHVKNVTVRAALIGFCLSMMAFAVIIAVVIGLVIDAPEVVMLLAIVAAVGLWIYVMYMLMNNWLAQKMDVTVYDDRLHILYRRIPFFDRRHNSVLRFDDIASYKVDDYPGYILTLYLKFGGKFRVAANSMSKAGEIPALADAVVAAIERYNTGEVAAADVAAPGIAGRSTPVVPAAAITRRKTLYEGPWGIVLAVFFIAAISAIVIGILFFPGQHKTKDVVSGIAVSLSGLGYVLHIFNVRKKAKRENR